MAVWPGETLQGRCRPAEDLGLIEAGASHGDVGDYPPPRRGRLPPTSPSNLDLAFRTSQFPRGPFLIQLFDRSAKVKLVVGESSPFPTVMGQPAAAVFYHEIRSV